MSDDFVILFDNPLKVRPVAIHDKPIFETIKEGKTAYASAVSLSDERPGFAEVFYEWS